MRWMTTAALAALIGAAGPAAAAEMHLISYEAIPSVQTDIDLAGATYDQRAELTAMVRDAIAPQVIAALAMDGALIETDLTPGGYLLNTNASLQARGQITEVEAIRLAAALGYVLRQWSVMVSRFDDDLGDTGYVVVSFPEDALTPEAAQAFFEAAAQLDEGLGGGYTAFGDEMIFLNVRDGEHVPYSGLDDIAFAALLGQAAGAFDGAELMITRAGYAHALFVGNDWNAATQGEDYARTLNDPELVAELDALRAAHEALVLEFADRHGWR
ncbi:MAG: hypothetical protein ACK4WC_07060 [Rubrimonas sp.]